MKETYFEKPLSAPKAGEKIYELTPGQINEILRVRGAKTELDPGMGGVSPQVLMELLQTSSELVSVDIALTSACNFKCVHCYRPGEEWGNWSIDFDLICKVVEQAAELGTLFIILTGGEPLMYSSKSADGKKHDYFDVVDKIYEIYAKAGKEVKILTFTDVALVTEEKAKKFAEKKVALCLKRDTLDYKLQDEITAVPGSSEKIEEGYKNLFEAGYGKAPRLGVSVNQVLRKGKFDTLKGTIDLHRWVKSNGMEHSIVPIHYCGEAIDEEQEDGIHPLEVKALYDILEIIDGTEFGDPWTVYSPFPKNKTCNRPGRGVHIRATGKVTACSESPLIDSYTFGDINSENLIDIIRSDKFKSFREDFEKREGKFVCNSDACDLNGNYLCRGGCATRSAFSKLNPETGIIERNANMFDYCVGREDPLCPAWVVLAQKQGVLKAGLYESAVDLLLSASSLDKEYAKKIRDKIVENFNGLRTSQYNKTGK